MMTQCREIGTETVSGRSATKWQMQMRTMTMQSGTGYVWVDSQLNTAVKWDFSDQEAGELDNIQHGPQPASLFDLPAGYRKQDLPTF